MLGKEEGFTGGSVTSIIQDRQGFVWIAAAGGLYRYDGHSFKILKPDPGLNSLASSSISAVIEDRKGDLWVGTDGGGLARYDATAGRFERIRLSPPENSGRYGGNQGDRISALAQDDSGRILVGSADGSVRFVDPEDGETALAFMRELDGKAVNSLFVDSKGVIWVGTDGAGLLAFDAEGKPSAAFHHDPRDSGSISSDRVSAIIEDSLGFLWIGFADGGIDLFEEGRFRHATREAGEERRIPPVTTLAEDVRGQIWAGFQGGGVSILDPSSMEALVSSFADGKEVRFLMRDRRGLMWAGLDRGGLLTGDLRSATFSRYAMSREGKAIDSISSIAELPSGTLIASSRTAGILTFDPLTDSFSAIRSRAGEIDPGDQRVVLAAEDGSLWIGTSGSGLLLRSPDGSVRHFRHEEGRPESLASSSILSLLEAGRGRLWVGTEGGGLDLFDPSMGEAQHWGMGSDQPALMPASIITCLIRDSR
ncbi:MAG: two-component regulator propeller domain-containing protein, partial [Candidatus Shapirobacteria bacterium]